MLSEGSQVKAANEEKESRS